MRTIDSIEERLKFALGEILFTNIALQMKVEELEAALVKDIEEEHKDVNEG